jgi:hypothetical protein
LGRFGLRRVSIVGGRFCVVLVIWEVTRELGDGVWLVTLDATIVVFPGVGGWGLADCGFVACRVDRVHDLLIRDSCRNRHVGGFQGEIDAGFNALKLAELPFNPIDA